jgi:hypothetical protein
MKVFALGGYGKVGLPAVKLLAQSDLVTGIAIGGRSLERAEKAAAEIGDKATPIQVDSSDEAKLLSTLTGYDIVINAALDDTVVPTIRAAIRVGADYCDANVVNDQALQLKSDAKAAGITAVIATGICPCISNLMGVHAARQLDEVEQLQLGFPYIFNWENGHDLTPQQWHDEPDNSLSALHAFRPFIGWMLSLAQESGVQTAQIYHDGQWVGSDPVRNGTDIPLSQGGTGISHPYLSIAPLFGGLPNDLSRVPPVEMYFSPLPPQLHDLLREHSLRVLNGEMDSETATDAFLTAVDSDPHRWLTLPEDYVVPTALWVRAMGHKNDSAGCASCWFVPSMWNVEGWFLTSVSLTVAVRKILRGEVQKHGVMVAEKVFEPLPFFDEIIAVLPDPPPDGRLIDESFDWLQ